jgi:NADPH-dependent curcumin reductase CurA
MDPGRNLLPATMGQILSKSLTLRGFINYEFAREHYSAFLQAVSAVSLTERFATDGLAQAPTAFIGMLEGHNFGKALVHVADRS